MAEEFEIAKAVYRVEVAGLKLAEETLQAFGDKIKELNDKLLNLKASLSSSTSFGQAVDIAALVGKVKELEIELEKMTAKESAARKEVEALTAAQKTFTSQNIALNTSLATSGKAAETVAAQFRTYKDAIDAVSAARKKANELGGAVTISGIQDETLKEEVFDAEQLEEIEKRIIILLNQHNEVRKDALGIINAENLADEESVAIAKRRIAELKTAIAGAAGKQEVTITGLGTIDISEAQRQQAVLETFVKNAQISQKQLREDINTTENSMNQLGLSVERLTPLVKLLTQAEEGLDISISPRQWAALRDQLIQINPDFEKFTIDEVRSGEAGKELGSVLVGMKERLNQFQQTISGKPTLVQDYTKGIVDAFRKTGFSDILQEQRVELQTALVQQTITVGKLRQEYDLLKSSGSQDLDALKQKIIEAGKAQQSTVDQIKNINASFRESGTIGATVTNSLATGFENLGRKVLQTAGIYIGLQAAIAGVSRAINIDKDLTDKFADLQRVLGGTREEVDGVVDSLRNINTRTPITELADMAVIAAKAGVAKDDIAGVTEAINRLKLVVGKDFGGDIETATENIVKLTNIFIGQGQATAENISKISNAIITLDQTGVATADFITKFAEEMSGMQGITKIGLPSVLGLGAAFQETGIRAEVASTAISQILIRIAADLRKYAALANNVKATDVLDSQVESFRKLLREDPGKALITLAVGLKANKTNFDEFGKSFADLGAKGFKVTSVFGDLADKAALFTQRIEIAKGAIQGQNVLIDGAAIKEENLAGVLDKVSAKFELAFSNPKFLEFLKTLGEGLLNLTNFIFQFPFQFLITGIVGASAAFLAWKLNMNGSAIATRLFGSDLKAFDLINRAVTSGIITQEEAEALRAKVTIGSAEAQGTMKKAVQLRIIYEGLAAKSVIAEKEAEEARNIVGLATETVIEKEIIAKDAARVSNLALAESEDAVAVSTEAVNVATKASPLGIIFALLGIIIPLYGAFGAKLDDSTEKLKEQNKELDNNQKIQDAIAESISKNATETQGKVEIYVRTLKDEHATLETRKAVYNELIKLSPDFEGAINADAKSVDSLKLNVDLLNDANRRLVTSLNEVATAKAFQDLNQQAGKEIADLTGKQIRLQIETEKTQKQIEDLGTEPKAQIRIDPNTGLPLSGQDIDLDKQDKRNKLLADQQKLTQDGIDLQKKIDDANVFQAAVHEKTVEFTTEQTEKSKIAQSVANNSQEGLDELKTKALADQKVREEKIQRTQKDIEIINKQLSDSTVELTQKQRDNLNKKIEQDNVTLDQLSVMSKNEEEFKRRSEIVNNNTKDVSDITSNIAIANNTQVEETKKVGESNKINIKSQEEVIGLLEKQRDNYNQLIAGTIAEIASVDKGSTLAFEQEKKLATLIKARNAINAKLKELGVSLSNKEGLSPQEQSILKFLEAEKELELAQEEERFAKIKEVRKPELEEEETFNRNIYNITKKWNDLKIQNIEGFNNAEKLERAKIGKQTVDIELQNNTRILEIRQQFLNEDARISRKHLDARKQQLLDEIELLRNVPDATNEEIASSHKHLDDVMLQETVEAYSTLIIEAQKFGLSTEVLEEERNKRVAEINKDALQANKELYDAYFQDISVTIRKQLSEETESINRLREKILSSNKADFFKDQDLGQLDKLQKLVEAIDKVTEAERKYRSMQFEADIVLRSSTKVTEDYLHSQVSSNLAVERMAVSFKGSDKVILSTVDDTKKLDTETKNLITTTEILNKATREQSNSQHDAVVKAREDVRTATENLLGGVNDLGTIQGLAKEGIESLFKGLFKVDPKDVEEAKAKGGQAWEDMQNEIKKKTQGREVVGKVLASAFETAGLAMQTYFDNELNNINRNKQALEDRIDVETAQLKARAQSQAESDAIDREAAAKKKAVERDAANQEKKVKIQELKLALALEIANIAASAAKLLFPLNLIEFAALSGLAYARYALNVSAVNSATFAKGIRLTLENVDNFTTGGRVNKLFSKGGKLLRKWFVNDIFETSKSNLPTQGVYSFATGGQADMETIRGGKVKGRSHADGGNKFLFKGRIFEDEVDELNIIRTRNAPKNKRYQISGTQEQIASALNVIGGGITFNGGADIKHLQFGGILSDNLNRTSPAFTLQAPNPQSIIRINQSNSNLERAVEDLTKNVKEVSRKVDQTTDNLILVSEQANKRIDNIKTYVVSKEIRKSDNDAKKASSIGRL